MRIPHPVFNMNLTENILLICLVFTQVFSNNIRIARDENATDIIKETQERINKNIYNNSASSSAIETCGGIFSQPQFLIESPNYPSNYPNNLNCLFILKGPYCDTNYTLQFLDFNLEDSLGCSKDRLEIKEQDAICGIREGIKMYNSKSGALILSLVTDRETSARGFRILVSRSYCNYNVPPEATTCNPITTVSRDFESGVKFDSFPKIPSNDPTQDNSPYPSPYPSSGFYPTTKHPSCCASTYNTKHFYIASPGFPSSYNTPTECQFTIFRANPKVCRLRIHFKFFWHGIQNPSCTHGYLQIDGKLICGCQTGMKLVSPFDGSFGNTKVFRFKNIGVPREVFSGFVIEVIQDECPKRYVPEERNFHFYNDEINRVAWPNTSQIRRDTEIFEPVDLGYRPKVVKHVYFFDSPEFSDANYDVGYSYNKPRDVEETTYLETADLDFSYAASDFTQCRSWGVYQWNLLQKDILWQIMPKCNVINNRPEGSRCKEYSFTKGYFQSPGYPYFYPKNSNICYRFYKQMGFCKIRLVMVDFQVEDSFDCLKDYLVFNGNFRYCGRSLANTFTLFDMSGKSYEEIKFVSDMLGSGRGFRGIYEQIPCSGLTQVPETPIWTTTISPLPRPPGTTVKPSVNTPCSNKIKDNYFTIDIYDYGKEMCNFVIETNNADVCELELELITLDFPCDSEYILINNTKYCGKLSGKTIMLNFTEKIEIIYKRLTNEAKMGLKLHLVGRQIDCEVKIPPAARISDVSRRSGKQDFKGAVTQKGPEKSEEVSVTLKRKYKEVCGIIMNIKSTNSTESICEFIKSNGKNVACNPITSKTIYVPYNKTDKLELKFKSPAILENIEFKEITCDNKFIL